MRVSVTGRIENQSGVVGRGHSVARRVVVCLALRGNIVRSATDATLPDNIVQGTAPCLFDMALPLVEQARSWFTRGMPAPTQHCHKCGWEWTFHRPPGRSETCLRCQADLKVCLNCAHYDVKVAYHCREKRAEEVADKASANFCEYFEMARKEFVARGEDSREAKARDSLRKLLGD